MSETALQRAEELAERVLPDRRAKKRMLVIVNPYATTVSNRLKNLVVYALQGRYDVEAIDTQSQGHATELCHEAARTGYDVVVAFGGDGTVNEVANGLAGTDTPITCLPGGATNVYCRTLGIPNDVVDATEHLLSIADDFRPRRVDTGLVNGRHFVFASGIGLDASVVERVDAHPYRKAKFGEYYFTWAAISSFNKTYLLRPPRVKVDVGSESVEGVTVIVQNSDPFTYFGTRPIRICEGAGLDTGTLALTVLRRATLLEMPTLIPRIFSGRARTVTRHRQVTGFDPVEGLTVTSVDGREFPVEADGDFLGNFDRVDYGVAPKSLAVVA
ncbi:MAG TPA: diacylglycerol kinase family protein [Thermoleophilaceae bacterium]|nr:diacylglycerol kinase family protein [Thermoleophilaceae bacterium]